jgi:hypothetical protein
MDEQSSRKDGSERLAFESESEKGRGEEVRYM